MKVQIGLPEIFVFCSSFLLVSSLTWQGWTFFGLGLFGAFIRFSLEVQKAKDAALKQKEVIDNMEDLGKSFVNFASILGKGNDGKVH